MNRLMVNVLVLLSFGCSHCFGQEKKEEPIPSSFKSHKELMMRIAAARSSIVSYLLEIDVSHTGDRPRLCDECHYYVEYSQVGDHFAYAIREKIDGNTKVRIQGRSGGRLISVFGSGDIFMSAWKESDEHNLFRSYVDWRAVGLGFCGDFPGRRFEAISGSISEWSWLSTDKNWVIPVENGIAKYRDPPLLFSGVEYEVDLLRGTYPVRFDFTPPGEKKGYSRWSLEIDKIHDEYLPVSATLECEGQITQIKFNWLMVNEPLEGGKVACQRLAKRFGLELHHSAK